MTSIKSNKHHDANHDYCKEKLTFAHRLKHLIIGKPHNPHDNRLFHKISLIAFFAWIGLGADALSSSSYGPEEAFLALQGHTYLGIFVALISALTIFVISASYSQIIELFPSGGGGYLAANKLLSPVFGMIAGSALIIDYVLTITISIAAGAAALFSFLPAGLHHYKILIALVGVVVLTILNLRGVKESVAPLIPIFLIFMITHAFVIVYVIATHTVNFPQLAVSTQMDVNNAYVEIGFLGVLFLILHAYSMGAGTYTGIEAVSNGISILREPRVKTAKRTMKYMAVSLAFIVVGLMVSYLLYKVAPHPGRTLNAVLFVEISRSWGTYGYIFVLVTLLSEAALLFIAAQTGFFGGPRILATLSDRFVIRNGVLIMGGSALAMMLLSNGSVKFLVVLYSINVFITFVLSQSGMVRYWWSARSKIKKWKRKITVNGVGLMLSTFILISVTILKFNEGGWITMLVTGALIGLVLIIKHHYNYVNRLIKKLDPLVKKAESSNFNVIPKSINGNNGFNSKAKTAVLLVRGYNGLGIHAIQNVIKNFGGVFKNFVFVEIGAIDAGNFKGTKEINQLKSQTKSEVNHYVNIMKKRGYYAEGFSAIGIDVVDEVAKLAPVILKKFPKAVFFGGQTVFPKDTFISRLLHNYTVFSVQRRLYNQGITVVVLPVQI